MKQCVGQILMQVAFLLFFFSPAQQPTQNSSKAAFSKVCRGRLQADRKKDPLQMAHSL